MVKPFEPVKSREKTMKTIKTLAIATVAVAAGAVIFAWSGLFNVAASSPHNPVVKWLLSTTMHDSVERGATLITVPDLEDEQLIRTGAGDFEAMCATCHGAPGREPDALGKGLNPPAPDLTDAGEHMTAAEIFWVTRHGVRMTGMPAWGITHDDEELWPIVAFITQELPETTPAEYLALARNSSRHTHDTPAGDDHEEPNERP
ncbi:MAG: cytochrome c, partial [Pseudomonadales bacterium]|nr:cytochrome c [Pseudomonadales bacterium]